MKSLFYTKAVKQKFYLHKSKQIRQIRRKQKSRSKDKRRQIKQIRLLAWCLFYLLCIFQFSTSSCVEAGNRDRGKSYLSLKSMKT